MQSLSQNQIARIKRSAKQRSKTTDLSHLMILDQEAQSRGYPNWASLEKSRLLKPQLFPTFQRTPQEMQQLFKRAKKAPGLYRRRDEEKDIRARISPLHEKYANPLSALIYARDFIKCLLQVKRFSIDGLSVAYSEMRVLLPYGLQHVSEGKYLIVGRDYTPVGMAENKWVDYKEFTNLHLDMSTEDFAPLGGETYLYNDGSTPWDSRKNAEAYLRRLEKLIEIVERKQAARQPS